MSNVVCSRRVSEKKQRHILESGTRMFSHFGSDDWITFSPSSRGWKTSDCPFNRPVGSARRRRRRPVGLVHTHLLVSSRCKHHGHMFPSGRPAAVSTILFTLWTPRTRFRTAPLLGPAAESFWCVCVVCVCVCVCGVALCCRVCVCVCVCVWRLMVLRWCVCHRTGGSVVDTSGLLKEPCSSEQNRPVGVERVQRDGRATSESISNLCYSLRCCC